MLMTSHLLDLPTLLLGVDYDLTTKHYGPAIVYMYAPSSHMEFT